MRKRLTFIALGLAAGLAFNAITAFAWTGPGTSPPGGNVGAPLNTGTTGQSKNGKLGVNESTSPTFPFEVNGASLLQGSVVDSGGIFQLSVANSYLNFGATTGSTGYGM